MTRQAHMSGGAIPAVASLRTLAELGDEGTGRIAETDLTPRSPFPVRHDWYERYWYGDRSPARWGFLTNLVWRFCSAIMSMRVEKLLHQRQALVGPPT
jgi:hypothetical protein